MKWRKCNYFDSNGYENHCKCTTLHKGTMALFKQENRQSDMSEQMTPPLAELPRQTLPGTSREPAIRARAPRGPLPRLVVTAYLEALEAIQSPSLVALRDPLLIVLYRVVFFTFCLLVRF